MEKEQQRILELYREWKAIGREKSELGLKYYITGKPRNERASEKFDELVNLVRQNPDDLVPLLVSDTALTNTEKVELMRFGGGAGLTIHENLLWVDFMAKLREHYNELPRKIQHSLDWLLKVHGW
jgi:hypothetical protein